MIRICYIIPSLSMGGTERQLTHLLRGLAPDHDLSLVCTHHDGALVGDARRVGAHVNIITTRGGWDLRLMIRLRPILRAYRPDIVHTFLFGFDWPANFIARTVGVPIIVSSRRELASWMKRRHIFMQRKANQYVDCIVANSHAVAEFAIQQEKADPTLFRIIPNGIDADEFVSQCDTNLLRRRYKVPFHRHIIGMVANFSPVKDHALFIETAAELIRRRADVHFLLVGRGPLEKDIERHIARHKLEDCFTRVTTVAEMADLYALMDVSVLCSKVEGFPNAIMESMAAGKPVVAAAVGGIGEIVRDGDTGRLVSSRNPTEWANAIDAVLNDKDSSHAMGSRAATYVRHELTVEQMIENYRRLYAELLAAKTRRH